MRRPHALILAFASVTLAAACATTEETAAPRAAPAPAAAAPATPATAPVAPALAAARAEGEALFNGPCANCHVRGPAPRQAVLAMKTHGEIVAALTTGKMMAQGRNLTPEQRAAIATYLTGGGPTG